MLFDGFDCVFDEDIDTFDGLFDRGISEHKLIYPIVLNISEVE